MPSSRLSECAAAASACTRFHGRQTAGQSNQPAAQRPTYGHVAACGAKALAHELEAGRLAAVPRAPHVLAGDVRSSLNSSSLASEGTSWPEVTATCVTSRPSCSAAPASWLVQSPSSAQAWLSQPPVSASVSPYNACREGGWEARHGVLAGACGWGADQVCVCGAGLASQTCPAARLQSAVLQGYGQVGRSSSGQAQPHAAPPTRCAPLRCPAPAGRSCTAWLCGGTGRPAWSAMRRPGCRRRGSQGGWLPWPPRLPQACRLPRCQRC